VGTGAAVTPTMEDYLEAILELQQAKGEARVKDIARRLGVRMPSVTQAIGGLVERDCARHERYEHVDLTAKGRRVAREMQRRHAGIRRFLTQVLGLKRPAAEREACALEHAMRPQTVDRLLAFVERAVAPGGQQGAVRGRGGRGERT
jgi:DtxR family Mn-dependent transcriptional regulator